MSKSQRDKEIEIAQGAGKAKRAAGKAVHGLTHTEVLTDFYKLKSDDARAAFARTWLAKSSEALNETWSVIYELLKLVEEEELYKKESSLNNSKIYDNFQEYFEDTLKRPFEEWARLEANYNYVSKYCPELFSSNYSEVKMAQDEVEKKEQEVILTASEYERLKNKADQYNPILHWELLQKAVDNQWILSTSEVKELIGVKPRASSFARGAFKFIKCGKIGNKSAWSVEKV
ncbi:hypothetical protein ACP6PL_07695 [Dapis sp. BLCC M126]|uniref:hypothetical protein n=1 Tax=Dapis sp. BLCC M126 TaxID=3400189 RepID=UPI003CF07000